MEMDAEKANLKIKPAGETNKRKKSRSKKKKCFPVPNTYDKKFPTFKKPIMAGYWSIDGTRTQHHNTSQLRYYIPCKGDSVTLDLNEGLEQAIRGPLDLDHEHIVHLLRWIELNYKQILDRSESPKWLKPSFICNRGTLSKILKSPYNGMGWMICAAKWKGNIYLCQYRTKYEKQRKAKERVTNDKSSYWGEKFRQFILSDTPNKPPNTSKPVNESEKFYGVFRSRLNHHNLLYRAEIEGVCSKKQFRKSLPLNDLKFIKVKTSKLSEVPEQEVARKKFRSLDLWAQMYLMGADQIVRGLREDCDGIVRRVVNESIAELVDNSKEFWKPEICMKFCTEFLNFVNRTVKSDCDKTIYQFERKYLGKIVVTQLLPTSAYAFIPDWYKLLPNEPTIIGEEKS